MNLRRSRQLAFLFFAVHGFAFVVMCFTALPPLAAAALALCVAISLAHSLRRHALLRCHRAIVGLKTLEEDGVVLQRRDGTTDTAAILGTSYVSPALTVLNLKIARRWRIEHVLIVPDNMEMESFRQLRVLLRWRVR